MKLPPRRILAIAVLVALGGPALIAQEVPETGTPPAPTPGAEAPVSEPGAATDPVTDPAAEGPPIVPAEPEIVEDSPTGMSRVPWFELLVSIGLTGIFYLAAQSAFFTYFLRRNRGPKWARGMSFMILAILAGLTFGLLLFRAWGPFVSAGCLILALVVGIFAILLNRSPAPERA